MAVGEASPFHTNYILKVKAGFGSRMKRMNVFWGVAEVEIIIFFFLPRWTNMDIEVVILVGCS